VLEAWHSHQSAVGLYLVRVVSVILAIVKWLYYDTSAVILNRLARWRTYSITVLLTAVARIQKLPMRSN